MSSQLVVPYLPFSYLPGYLKLHIILLQNILTIINLFLFKYQVCKLIDDSEKSKNPKVNISQDVITEWLLQNKVLSIAFESEFTI